MAVVAAVAEMTVCDAQFRGCVRTPAKPMILTFGDEDVKADVCDFCHTKLRNRFVAMVTPRNPRTRKREKAEATKT